MITALLTISAALLLLWAILMTIAFSFTLKERNEFAKQIHAHKSSTKHHTVIDCQYA